MTPLEKLKLLIFEDKYPYFSDEELAQYLEIFNNDIYLTASQLCLMKKDNAESITVGPITIKNADASYWQNLANKYLDLSSQANKPNDNNASGGYYNTGMRRADEPWR